MIKTRIGCVVAETHVTTPGIAITTFTQEGKRIPLTDAEYAEIHFKRFQIVSSDGKHFEVDECQRRHIIKAFRAGDLLPKYGTIILNSSSY